MYSVKQIVPTDGTFTKFKTITRRAAYPFMTDLPGVLLNDAWGGHSGREKHKAGENVWCVLLPSQEWLVTTVQHGHIGMCRKNGDSLKVGIDFKIVESK